MSDGERFALRATGGMYIVVTFAAYMDGRIWMPIATSFVAVFFFAMAKR